MPSESSQSSTQWHTSTLKIDRRAPVDTTDWRTVTSHSPPHPHLEVPLEPPFSIPITLQLLDFPELQKGQTHNQVDVYYPGSRSLNSSSTSFYLITPGGQQHPEQISTYRTARLRIIRYSTTNPVCLFRLLHWDHPVIFFQTHRAQSTQRSRGRFSSWWESFEANNCREY